MNIAQVYNNCILCHLIHPSIILFCVEDKYPLSKRPSVKFTSKKKGKIRMTDLGESEVKKVKTKKQRQKKERHTKEF